MFSAFAKSKNTPIVYSLLSIDLKILVRSCVVAKLSDLFLRNLYWLSESMLCLSKYFRSLLYISFSSILLKQGRIDIGLYFLNWSLSFALKTGVTNAIFSSFGSTPVRNVWLNMYVRGWTVYFDIFLTSFGARSSYPVALFSFNWLISTTTFFSVVGSKNTELLYELVKGTQSADAHAH